MGGVERKLWADIFHIEELSMSQKPLEEVLSSKVSLRESMKVYQRRTITSIAILYSPNPLVHRTDKPKKKQEQS